MTEIEELIRQAKAAYKRWRKPIEKPKLTERSWQEILDGVNVPYHHWKD